jgi:hypothetical protein
LATAVVVLAVNVNVDVTAAVAAVVVFNANQDMCCIFYLVKYPKITNNATTPGASEKNQIILNKISHILQGHPTNEALPPTGWQCQSQV